MLAHDPWQSMDRCSHQGVALLQFPKRQVERLFVPVKVLIIKIGIFVEPKCKAERAPASRFVDEDLFADAAMGKVMTSWRCTLTIKGEPTSWRGLDLLHFSEGKLVQKLTYAKAKSPLLEA